MPAPNSIISPHTSQRKGNVITPPESSSNHAHNSADVYRVQVDAREFIVVGTAHVSQESVDLVRHVITHERPDCVCVELDQQRYTALSQQRHLEDIDLKEIIRRKQLSPLIANVILSSYQKRLGGQLGVLPGMELLQATQIAQAEDIPIALCDRDVRVTLGRAWRSTPWYKKLVLLSTLMASVFDSTELDEDTLREMRQHDALSEMLGELGQALPSLHAVLIDERDTYLAQKIRESTGQRVVAVVGAAHVPGVLQRLQTSTPADLTPLNHVPPAAKVWHWVHWGVPVLILASLGYIAWNKGADVAGDNALFWVLANGIPSALGAVAALAHPLTAAAAFCAAPLTSLTPVIGAGYVTAFVQAYLCPPTVREFQQVGEDVRSFRAWWRNRLLRIFLAFLLPGIGSMIGTWIGGYEILSNLF